MYTLPAVCVYMYVITISTLAWVQHYMLDFYVAEYLLLKVTPNVLLI